MGKTPTPLRILAHPSLKGSELEELEGKGHEVNWMNEALLLRGDALGNYDLIVGPNCWRIVPALTKYLDLAVKATQKAKKEKL